MMMVIGPLDHRLVMGGQPLVVADGAAIPAEPGEGPLDDPAARQDLEGVSRRRRTMTRRKRRVDLAKVTSLPA